MVRAKKKCIIGFLVVRKQIDVSKSHQKVILLKRTQKERIAQSTYLFPTQISLLDAGQNLTLRRGSKFYAR